MDSKTEKLWKMAKDVALNTPGFTARLDAGPGNMATNKFVTELKSRTYLEFNNNYSETPVSLTHSAKFDYYFPEEKTVVEVAFGLCNPNTEFEKDIFKCLMAKETGRMQIDKLIFFSKIGGEKKCNQPFRAELIKFCRERMSLEIIVRDL